MAHTHGEWLCQYSPSPLLTPLGFRAVPPVIYYLLPLHLSSHRVVLPFLPSLHHPDTFLLLAWLCFTRVLPFIPQHVKSPSSSALSFNYKEVGSSPG